MGNIPFSGTAIVSMTLALVFYSIGTWAERVQNELRLWHIVFFLLGLTADTFGTTIMSDIAGEAGNENILHSVRIICFNFDGNPCGMGNLDLLERKPKS